MIGLNKIWLNQVQLNRLYLNAPFPVHRKMAGGGSSGDGFPVLPGDVTRWHFGGLTNEMMAAMDDPRIEDADGKGRFLSFKNFLWAGMSGVGGYNHNFNSWGYGNLTGTGSTQTHTSSKMNLNIPSTVKNTNIYSNATSVGKEGDIYDFTLKVMGLKDGALLIITKGVSSGEIERIEKDGIYKIYQPFEAGWDQSRIYIFISNSTSSDLNITIEQLPLYPGFIIGDGVDDFAVTEKELNFEDTYTVYTAFIPFQDDPARNMILCGKNHTKDFYMDYSNLSQISFYSANKPVRTFLSNGFNLFCCKRNAENMTIKNLVTGKSVTATSIDLIDNPGLYFLWKSATHNFYSKAAIAGQIIDNGHFTTDEEDEKVLNWHKKQYPWLFPDQAWTVVGKTNEDEDRATIANITGNDNNLVLSNFGFAENSGYGDYPISFSSSLSEGQPYGTLHFKTDGIYSNLIKTGVTNILIKFNLRGMPEGGVLSIRGLDPTTALPITEKSYTVDGLYEFVYNDSAKPVNIVFYNGTLSTGLFDFYVDIIPEYEGYLVTDGVDDKIQSSNFPMGKDFTIVGEWRLISVSSYNYAGIIKSNNLYVYNNASTGLNIYVCSSSISNYIHGVKSLKAIRSDGRVYDENWAEYKLEKVGNNIGANSTLDIGTNKNNFTKIAFKNLEIYNNKILSKEDCIKAYSYLQTLKAKI